MDAERRLDAHLAQAMDELLSLASLCAVHGRPELALRASAALDRLLGIPLADPGIVAGEPRPMASGDERHAQH